MDQTTPTVIRIGWQNWLQQMTAGEPSELKRLEQALLRPGAQPPDWYPFLKQAQYLGCAPWQLADEEDPAHWQIPAFWRAAAILAGHAEARVIELRSQIAMPNR